MKFLKTRKVLSIGFLEVCGVDSLDRSGCHLICRGSKIERFYHHYGFIECKCCCGSCSGTQPLKAIKVLKENPAKKALVKRYGGYQTLESKTEKKAS